MSNPFKYTGEYYDDESGLYYLKARYYDPGIGRFIGEDTNQGELDNPLSLNLYTYVENNPLSYKDPTGEAAESVIDIASTAYSAYEFYEDPSWENAAYLAWDAVATVIPFIPGSYAGKAAKLAKKVAKAADACNCFTAGTTVLTDEGEVPIEDIKIGDKVLAKSDETGEVAYKEVVGLFQKEADEIYYIHIGDEIIEVTGEHPFWLDGYGWTFVKDLKVGDLLVASDGTTLTIDKIEKEPRAATVYNFEVQDFNSYFVSNLGIWVHNCAVSGLGNPFKSKTFDEIDEMFIKKGFEKRGPNPISGEGGYVNPNTGRSYHLDTGGQYKKGYEPPHVDVNRLKTDKSNLKKKKYFIE